MNAAENGEGPGVLAQEGRKVTPVEGTVAPIDSHKCTDDSCISLGEIREGGKMGVPLTIAVEAVMSTSVFTPPMRTPAASNRGVGYGMNGTRVPSGRSAIASMPRMGRLSFSDNAMGHSSCGSGVPSGQKSFHEPQNSLLPSSGRTPHSSAAASL